jgi:hypothetical protein
MKGKKSADLSGNQERAQERENHHQNPQSQKLPNSAFWGQWSEAQVSDQEFLMFWPKGRAYYSTVTAVAPSPVASCRPPTCCPRPTQWSGLQGPMPLWCPYHCFLVEDWKCLWAQVRCSWWWGGAAPVTCLAGSLYHTQVYTTPRITKQKEVGDRRASSHVRKVKTQQDKSGSHSLAHSLTALMQTLHCTTVHYTTLHCYSPCWEGGLWMDAFTGVYFLDDPDPPEALLLR